MKTNENQYYIYLRATKQRIPCSKEQFDDYYRDINAYRRTQMNHGRCVCPPSKRLACDMDCFNCPYQTPGDMSSLDSGLKNDDGDEMNWLEHLQEEMPELFYGGMTGLRVAIFCMWLSCLFSVVTSDKVVYLFGKVSPMLSLGLTILLRLIPRIKREARKINLAQCGIGRGAGQGNLWQRFINCLRIFSMLITWMIQALGLEADSMRSRGSLLRGRTAFSIYRFDNRDRTFVIALFTCMTLTAMGVILGASRMIYNPRILWAPLDTIGVVTALGYAALCLLPMGLEIWVEYQFNRCRNLSYAKM